jgi:hypothetical protein
LALAPTSVHAQPAPSLAGHWIFETDAATANECIITGTAVLSQTDARGGYSVRLNAFERCRNGASWRAVQRCTARQTAAAMHIDCEIVEATPPNYAPDDFLLRIESAGRMDGSLISSWNAPTRWRRAPPALVS